MRGMKRIVLEIEMEEDLNVVVWRLVDWRGQVSAGVSVDTSDDLVHMWGGDIEHVMNGRDNSSSTPNKKYAISPHVATSLILPNRTRGDCLG